MYNTLLDMFTIQIHLYVLFYLRTISILIKILELHINAINQKW